MGNTGELTWAQQHAFAGNRIILPMEQTAILINDRHSLVVMQKPSSYIAFIVVLECLDEQ